MNIVTISTQEQAATDMGWSDGWNGHMVSWSDSRMLSRLSDVKCKLSDSQLVIWSTLGQSDVVQVVRCKM